MVYHGEVEVQSRRRNQLIDITSDVRKQINASGVTEGVCTICCQHTTAGVTINENADPDVVHDILMKLDKLVDQDLSFRHAEGNSDSHIKASLMGFSVQIPIQDGSPVLGTWQGVYFCEFDGPRRRRVTTTILGDSR